MPSWAQMSVKAIYEHIQNSDKNLNIPVLVSLIKNCNVNYRDPNGNTLLIHACNKGCQPIVELLLSNGADMSIQNNKQKTCFDYAVNHGGYSCKQNKVWETLVDFI